MGEEGNGEVGADDDDDVDDDIDGDDDHNEMVLPRATKSRASGSCSSCNRRFCLSYNLPICKGAAEGDVFTTCFR